MKIPTLRQPLRIGINATLTGRPRENHGPLPMSPDLENEAQAAADEAGRRYKLEKAEYTAWCEEEGITPDWSEEWHRQCQGVVTEWTAARRYRLHREERDRQYRAQCWIEVEGQGEKSLADDDWEVWLDAAQARAKTEDAEEAERERFWETRYPNSGPAKVNRLIREAKHGRK